MTVLSRTLFRMPQGYLSLIQAIGTNIFNRRGHNPDALCSFTEEPTQPVNGASEQQKRRELWDRKEWQVHSNIITVFCI